LPWPFLAVFREGVELALFTVATVYATSPMVTLLGTLAGLARAAVLGHLMFQGVVHLDMRRFFLVTSALLVIFASGMVAYGLHELIGASVRPAGVDPLYDVALLLSDKSGLGLALKTLSGYNANPALTESVAYVTYLVVIAVALHRSGGPRVAPLPA
jgi:high-affinity iron transporter